MTMTQKPFDFGVRIQRPGNPAGVPDQGHFCVCALAERAVTVFVDGAPRVLLPDYRPPPLKWQGSKASWGCALSHRAAIQAAIAAGAKRAVIFEADAEPAQPLAAIAATIQAALDRLEARDPRWGALYLGGYFPNGSHQIPLGESHGSGLIQADAVMLAHAYALSATGLAAALEVCDRAVSGQSLWPYGHIDVAFSTTLHSLCSIYVVDPWLFGQSEHISELTGKLCKRSIAAV